MSIPAALAIYSPDGATRRGTLPTIGLTVSAEVGGGGSAQFGALRSDLDAVAGWDSVAVLELDHGTGPTPAAVYALRRPFTRNKVAAAGSDSVWTCQATALAQEWAGHTVLMPEYAGSAMPRGAGEERTIGWQMTAYDPATDPREPWDGCYNTARTKLPKGWPSGAGAKWITVTGATDMTERKLFRAWLDLTGMSGTQLCRVWISSDESATLYIAGEKLVESASAETGYQEFTRADIVLSPHRFAVAVDTATDFTKGGDGIDPILVAVAVLDDNGDPQSWPLVSDAADWVACRRNDEPPGEEPPGPTPGQVILALLAEAQVRGVEGWANVTADFTDALDSYGQPWPEPIVERVFRLAADTMWSILSALAETDEVDCWIEPGLVLRAAPRQGTTTATVTLDSVNVASMREERPEPDGSWAAGLTVRGWVDGSIPGPRREYMVELGTAGSFPIAGRILAAALRSQARRDFTADLLPTIRPMVDLVPGDTVHISYGDVAAEVTVLSLSGRVTESVLTWQAELVEVAP